MYCMLQGCLDVNSSTLEATPESSEEDSEMSQPLIHDLIEEGEDDICDLMMQVQRHQPYEVESVLSVAPSNTSSSTVPSSPSVRPACSSQRPYSSAAMSMGAPKRRKKTMPPAEQAVSILQTLVEQKCNPPPPANDTENDFFFKMLAKKVAKLPQATQNSLRMKLYTTVFETECEHSECS